MRLLRLTSLVVFVALGVAACGGHEEAAREAAGQPRAVSAHTQVVSASREPRLQATPAVLVAAERVEVASRLMGYIHEVAVKEGQAVRQGQRLFSVDPVDVQGQVEQAKQSVRLAEAAYADAQADFERYSKLFEEEVVTRQQYEKSKLQQDIAATRLAQAKAGLTTAGGQLRYATVTAPIDGVVTHRLADPGDMAAPGKPVLVLEDMAHTQVETQVPEAVFQGLRLGDKVAVEVDGQTARIEGRVARLPPSADPVSHTFMVKLDISGAGLKPGGFARVFFPQGEQEVLKVPRAAVVSRAGIDGVFVVAGDGIARFRMVRLGVVGADAVEIQAGLGNGERVVVEGADKLESGDKVTG